MKSQLGQKLRAEDEEKVKQQHREQERIRIAKKRKEDNTKVKEEQKKRQRVHRYVASKSKRLKDFREATMYNAIFICTCCQQRMFQSNIRLYNDELKEEINGKMHEHISNCVEKEIPTWINCQKIYTYV